MLDVDAALKQQILNISQRQPEPNVHHHHEPEHLGRRSKNDGTVSVAVLSICGSFGANITPPFLSATSV